MFFADLRGRSSAKRLDLRSINCLDEADRQQLYLRGPLPEQCLYYIINEGNVDFLWMEEEDTTTTSSNNNNNHSMPSVAEAR